MALQVGPPGRFRAPSRRRAARGGCVHLAKWLRTAAAGVTGYSRVLGKKIELASSPEPARAERAEEMPIGVEQAQRQLRVTQWTIPLLTGALEVLNALHGEQQRPGEQARGMAARAAQLPGKLLAKAG